MATATIKLGVLVDCLGSLKAKISKLQEREKELKAELAASGKTEIDGEKYRATVSESERKSINWKAVAEYLKPSPQLLTAHTSYSDVMTVKVVARKT